jgi:hypothetical protein
MSNCQKCFPDQVKVIAKGKQIIGLPHIAALLTRGGTGISSSDFLTLLNTERTSVHKTRQQGKIDKDINQHY